MNFNDNLCFTPTFRSLQELDRPFHILLSHYLRESRTFELYDAVFKAKQIDACLLPLERPLGDSDGAADLSELMNVFRSNENFRSMLVSDPFKQAFISLVDQITPQAKQCGAINMVYKDGQSAVGGNCDGTAFVTGAISAHSLDFKGKRMLFFGCGGVSSAVAVVLADTLEKVGLVDLNCHRTKMLAAMIRKSCPGLPVELIDSHSERNFIGFDVFYNGTGLGKGTKTSQNSGASPLSFDDKLPSEGIAFDANYTPAKTPFLEQLESHGFRVFNGLTHMLSGTAIHLSLVTGLKFDFHSIETVYKSTF